MKLNHHILRSHSVNGEVCEHPFLGLDPLPEQILTLEPLLDFSQFPKSVLVHVLSESKFVILSFHTPFGDKGVDSNNSEIIVKI